MKTEYQTTKGEADWDDKANHLERADDPVEPDGDGWVLRGSVMTDARRSVSFILWFWSREVPETR